VRAEFPELMGGLGEFAKKHIAKLIRKHFGDNSGIEIVHEVTQGKPENDLRKCIRRHNIDLVIVGKLSNKNIAEKLVRTAPCSVLVMPPAGLANLTRILVPVDFSARSAEAMKVALALASAAAVPEIICMHVFRVPNAYYKLGKSHALLAALERKKQAAQKYKKFIRRFDLKGLAVKPLFVLHHLPARAIEETVKRERIDLVILFAHSLSAGAAVILGSVMKRLIQMTEVPLVAVKKKGAKVNLRKVLLEVT
jgi:nucleotide-binding universal stress UspA family protein